MPEKAKLGNVKGLAPSLPERGKIKIGRKNSQVRQSQGGGTWQAPEKIDHFLITTMARDPKDNNYVPDTAIMKALADAGYADPDGKLRRIPVRLLFDDIDLNMQSRRISMVGTKQFCFGDGEVAFQLTGKGDERKQVNCPCFRAEQGYAGKDKCKINAVLSVIIDGIPGVGGVWRFRTTSNNSVEGLLSSMEFMEMITRGRLAGVPMELKIYPKNTQTPEGKPTTVYVVALMFNGTIEELQGHAVKLLEQDSKFTQKIKLLEDRTRAENSNPLDDEKPEEVAKEYYPESVNAEAAENAKRQQQQNGSAPTNGSAPAQTQGSDAVVDVEGKDVEEHDEGGAEESGNEATTSQREETEAVVETTGKPSNNGGDPVVDDMFK